MSADSENFHLLRQSSRPDGEEIRRRSLRELETPTSSMQLRTKQHPSTTLPCYLESPLYSSESDTNSSLPNSGLDSDSSESYSPLSLRVSIPRCIHDMCHEVSSDDVDEQFDSESPNNNLSTQIIYRQTRGLTARQRAISGLVESELLELPYYDKPKELTEEMKAKKAEIALQRRIQNQQQQERNKAETIRKLLSRQTPAKKKEERKASRYNPDLSYVSYISSRNGITLTFPACADIELRASVLTESYSPRDKPICAVAFCSATSKYRDPRTRLPYCSLQCYKVIKQLATGAERDTT